jgi:hypothetical protein
MKHGRTRKDTARSILVEDYKDSFTTLVKENCLYHDPSIYLSALRSQELRCKMNEMNCRCDSILEIV